MVPKQYLGGGGGGGGGGVIFLFYLFILFIYFFFFCFLFSKERYRVDWESEQLKVFSATTTADG